MDVSDGMRTELMRQLSSQSVPRPPYLSRDEARKYKIWSKPAPQVFDPGQLLRIMQLGDKMTYFMVGAVAISPV